MQAGGSGEQNSPPHPKKIQTVGAKRVAGDCFTAPTAKIANWDEEKTRRQDAWRKKDPPTPDHLKVISDAREKHEKTHGLSFNSVPFGAKVIYKPISSKVEFRLHQFGKKNGPD